ncbi:MAG: DUF302 domain-containing protein [Gammaproteobacteria bacterium]|jgi:uncharacterized protein (DUF302 family)|nr:DUF302 domain-containing protein [Gammaproteobacteria bacterium]MBT4605447.1 DUF302 domain-containing protein [Thiotrichales bacterium]MBT3473406.1 DUF302 domain-containing protein [Gammaproteobacteria bacterium]MBT3967463.1 DUF302 domain-containing protein [Gammaproteobacteria bacterium]MBT4080865.1 DUF302 domain-containing protein [Gammaproteobacteria bacterium]
MKKVFRSLIALGFTLSVSLSAFQANAGFGFNDLYVATDVEAGITGADVDESIKQLAISEGILHVAMFPLSKQVEKVTGSPYRHLSIHNICDAKTASLLADVSDAFVIVMPCRIAVVEGKDGVVRMWSMNPAMITMMQMPEEQQRLAKMIAGKMQNIINGAAEGAF